MRYHRPVTRRTLSIIAVASALIAACGIDLAGTRLEETTPNDGGGVEASVIDGAPTDSSVLTDAGADVSEGPVLPSNVDASLLAPDAGDLIGPMYIDTLALTINGALPAVGISFVHDKVGAVDVAVLSVGAFVVDKVLDVSGDRGLVILASGDVSIKELLRVDGQEATITGPGGFGPGLGPLSGGAGGPGENANNGGNDNSGGGGGGHGTRGANGGSGNDVAGGDGGSAYAIPMVGGSGGGRGDPPGCNTRGGAGGGALQVFSRTTIAIGPLGMVHAGGGGGDGALCSTGSAAGGGAGGYILLEAPSLTVHGVVAANGGGGGGSDTGGFFGTRGQEGQFSDRFADGGTGFMANGGSGGTSALPTAGGSNTNSAGGGGAAGLIYFHYRGSKIDRDGGIVSPASRDDGGL